MPEEKSMSSAIVLPGDQYGHPGAPSEWWWHTGTLVGGAPDGSQQIYGFEINAMRFAKDDSAVAVMELELVDVQANKHYEITTVIDPCPPNWCSYDESAPWRVSLDNGKGVSIAMSQIDSPLHMNVVAIFKSNEGTDVAIHLDLQQQGPPLLVWGTGCKEGLPDKNLSPIDRNNYYYSLTNLSARGNVHLRSATHSSSRTVSGVTWMDHEYGYFPGSYDWVWCGIRLDNGVSLLNYTLQGERIAANTRSAARVTLLIPGQGNVFIHSAVELTHPRDINFQTYYEGVKITFDDSVSGELHLVSLVANQEILGPEWIHNVFEGVASCSGTLNGEPVTGTAWLEQKYKSLLGAPTGT